MEEISEMEKVQNQHGKLVFTRYIMLLFLEGLEKTSDEFVFKGGNLLWHYIKTPRETIDLDLSTITLCSHNEVKQQIEKSFSTQNEISFSIKEFYEVHKEDGVGSKLIIKYKSNRGQQNQFQIDIVYALPTDLSKVKSTISEDNYKAASIENIIADKMSASLRYGSGNTRVKDFDDLWRISKSKIIINKLKINKIFKERSLKFRLPMEWVEYIQDSWGVHAKGYKDIPRDLNNVFNEINSWLSDLESE